MLTPNDIANKKFDKAMGGYRIDDVEAFLSQVSDTVIALYEDKKNLEEKIEILAEKLEEYRADEDSLRNALLGAQKLGDSVIRESKAKAEVILRDASAKAERMVDNAQLQIEREKMTLVRMQSEVSNFKARLLATYKKHIELIGSLPGNVDAELSMKEAAPEPAPAVAEKAPVTVPSDENAVALDELFQPSKEEAPALTFQKESAEEKKEEIPVMKPQTTVKTESKFGPLKFGAGYDLQRDSDTGFSKKKR
ncbi:DivIVA domain-containing protein [Phocea massiliensis]|uniref:Septum site-determining protein DivIVA n=1 Tax=uncultured Anaerotruncus sp. TaxID=905011 RepID=A0A6N2SBV6_9FIRM|nr:DivIVA domain-containing protein [Merdimmobilis hominis]MCD4836276.1 DivIVA domain-containing protein [Merdimmobilis hominis]